jgi:cysteinyl-tRNA synthetase
VPTEFAEALNNDLNVPLAISVVFESIKQLNKAADPTLQAQILKMLEILGISHQVSPKLAPQLTEAETKEVEALIHQRNLAKQKRDFATADQIRDALKARGITLTDTPNGTEFTVSAK